MTAAEAAAPAPASTPDRIAPPGRAAALRRIALLTLPGVALTAGCFFSPDIVREQRYPAATEFTGPVQVLAVAPFQAALGKGRSEEEAEAAVGVSGSERGALAGAERTPERTYGGPGRAAVGDEEAAAGMPAADVAALVARQVTEALAGRGAEVHAPEDVQRALGIEQPAAVRLDPEEAARQVAARLGADALLVGRVDRFRQRQGEALGAERPASVSFSVQLYSAPGGRLLWSGLFDETQEPLSANLFKTARYPGGGTRWLRVEELSRWGAENVAKSMPFLP